MDLARRVVASQHWHIQVHQDDVEVLTTAFLGDVFHVAFQTLLTIGAGLYVHVNERAHLHLDRDDVVADVFDE